MRKRFQRGSYAGRQRTPKKHAHPLGPATFGKSIGAIRQEYGLPYYPAPPRGFRDSDAGKQVFDPDNRTLGEINDFSPSG